MIVTAVHHDRYRARSRTGGRRRGRRGAWRAEGPWRLGQARARGRDPGCQANGHAAAGPLGVGLGYLIGSGAVGAETGEGGAGGLTRTQRGAVILSGRGAVRERSARAARRADEPPRGGGPDRVRNRSSSHRQRAGRDPAAPCRSPGRRPRKGRSEALPLRSLRHHLARRVSARAMPNVRRAEVLRSRYRAAVRGVGSGLNRAFASTVAKRTLHGLVRPPYSSSPELFGG